MAVVAGALGIAGIGVPFVEIGIAVLVVVFGAIVAFDLKAPTVAAMGVVGLFAVFHGHAHGAEIPEDAGGVAYAAGFITATALLHLAGIGAGFLIGKAGEHYGSLAVRLVGGFATAAGWRFSLAFSDLSRGVPHNLSGDFVHARVGFVVAVDFGDRTMGRRSVFWPAPEQTRRQRLEPSIDFDDWEAGHRERVAAEVLLVTLPENEQPKQRRHIASLKRR